MAGAARAVRLVATAHLVAGCAAPSTRPHLELLNEGTRDRTVGVRVWWHIHAGDPNHVFLYDGNHTLAPREGPKRFNLHREPPHPTGLTWVNATMDGGSPRASKEYADDWDGRGPTDHVLALHDQGPSFRFPQ